MSENLQQYFKNFVIHANLSNLDDYDKLYKFCIESFLENIFLKEEDFISYFEKENISEYIEQGTKKERAEKWYKKYDLLFNALRYLSKDYNITYKK